MPSAAHISRPHPRLPHVLSAALSSSRAASARGDGKSELTSIWIIEWCLREQCCSECTYTLQIADLGEESPQQQILGGVGGSRARQIHLHCGGELDDAAHVGSPLQLPHETTTVIHQHLLEAVLAGVLIESDPAEDGLQLGGQRGQRRDRTILRVRLQHFVDVEETQVVLVQVDGGQRRRGQEAQLDGGDGGLATLLLHRPPDPALSRLHVAAGLVEQQFALQVLPADQVD